MSKAAQRSRERDEILAQAHREPRRRLEITGTIDIEAADWNHFILGCAHSSVSSETFYDLDDLINHVDQRGGTWWCHAGGVYDMLAILDRILKRGISAHVDRSQHRVTRIVFGRVTIRDSYAIWPVPLDDIAGALGRPTPKLPWSCTCGKSCGGYCQITIKAAGGEPDLEAYCRDDARTLYDGLQLLDDFAEKNDLSMKGTLGQTAWVNAQRDLGVPDSEVPFALWRHIRSADRGGRQMIIRPRAQGPGTHYDICNAYPAQLAKSSLPVGAHREIGSKQATACLDRNRPGVYSCAMFVPEDSFLPPLPWLVGGQMTFPTGRFDGTWTLPEINCALARGAVIEKVHSAVVWEAEAPVFAELVQRWYDIRRKTGRRTPLGQWIGRLAKAVTGKFAERPDRSRVMIHPDKIKICLRVGHCKRGCVGRCGAYEPLDLFGHVWSIPYQKMSQSAYPQWSAYLRALTRIQLLEQAERMGNDLVLSNTDSMWVTGNVKPSPLGDGLGDWELQTTGPGSKIWWDMEIRTPTIYAYRYDEPKVSHDTIIVRGVKHREQVVQHGPLVIKGVPGLTEDDWRRGTGTIDRGVITFGRAVKTSTGLELGATTANLFQKRVRKWSLPTSEREWYGDRRVGAGGVTFPADAQLLREVSRKRKRR